MLGNWVGHRAPGRQQRKRRTVPTPLPAPAARYGTPAPLPRWLDLLRAEAQGGRLARRCDLDAVCTMAGDGTCPAAQAPGRVFLCAVAAARGVTLAMHRPGSTSRSFDEAWAERLIVSIRDGDGMATEFALRSRLPRTAHRRVRFLAGLVAAQLDSPDRAPAFQPAASQSQPAASCNEG